jgi:hypothetical protein
MTTSPESKRPPYSPKRSFKNYLIDSRLQLKYAGLLVLITALISAALFYFLRNTSRAVVGESQSALAKSRIASEATQRALTEALRVSEIKRKWYVNNPMFANNPKLLELVSAPSNDADQELKKQRDVLAKQQQELAPQHEKIVRQQRTMLWTIIGGLAILVMLIGLVGIYVTHKVAGPIYKMRLLLKQVGDGKLVKERHLRKGDELQDFMGALATMVDGLRERQEKEVAALDEAIKLAQAGGASVEAITRLTGVRDEMKSLLEA